MQRPGFMIEFETAVSGAKQAKKDDAGQAKRLANHHASLQVAAKECEARLLQAITDSAVHNEVQREIGTLCIKSVNVCATALHEEAELHRKQLHEKDLHWKVKLETNRVAASTHLRNEALKIEEASKTTLMNRLREQREQLLGPGALQDALSRLGEAEDKIHELQLTTTGLEEELAFLKHGGGASSQLDAGARAALEQERNAEVAQLTERLSALEGLRHAAQEADRVRHLELSADRDRVREALDSAMAQVQMLRSAQENGVAALEAARQDARAWEAACTEACNERDAARHACHLVQTAAEATTKLEHQLATASAEAAAARSALDDLRRGASGVKMALERANERCAALEASVASLTLTQGQFEEVSRALRASEEKRAAMAASARADAATKDDALRAAELQVAKLGTELDALSTALQVAQADAATKGAEASKLARSIDAIGGALADGEGAEGLSTRLHLATTRIAKLEEERSRLVKRAIQSMASLRGHLVRTLAGCPEPSILVNGLDALPQMGLLSQKALTPAELAAISRKRLELNISGNIWSERGVTACSLGNGRHLESPDKSPEPPRASKVGLGILSTSLLPHAARLPRSLPPVAQHGAASHRSIRSHPGSHTGVMVGSLGPHPRDLGVHMRAHLGDVGPEGVGAGGVGPGGDAPDTTLFEQRIDELLAGDRSAVPGSDAGADQVLGRPASAGRRRNATRHAAQRGAAMLAAPLQEEIMSRLLSGGEKTRDRASFRRPLETDGGEPLYTVMYSRLYDAL